MDTQAQIQAVIDGRNQKLHDGAIGELSQVSRSTISKFAKNYRSDIDPHVNYVWSLMSMRPDLKIKAIAKGEAEGLKREEIRKKLEAPSRYFNQFYSENEKEIKEERQKLEKDLKKSTQKKKSRQNKRPEDSTDS